MLRRVAGTELSRTVARLSVPSRRYTNYDHLHYATDTKAVLCILGYFVALWFVMLRIGSLFSCRAKYKDDYLRVWRRKLGTGYQWSDAWGPQIDTFFRNVPDRAV
ncbi:uncharacterized protein TEOVI_000878400 [Trypanosoma equiperdum]|uniref:Uncharacterized protein n=3 Tax=Trypanozoon TaxID=39700 RepID=Q38AY6_TRYB2|nr:hypothetical protein, conserved [Trypanosoma brucei brucei TREU927]EAN78034.1 hypothetical protein, conserved [Trypanosoma brucei brucei TREU927]RHW69514.1 hypothetical protein DPX39_100067800 [Trypanosoma brucei equiperdum]SCU73182.1 hypothetical protein, conserved [Trypanosoma equiperdum]